MSFVLDASVTASWLFADSNEADAGHSLAVLQRLRSPEVQAVVPATWSLEIANVLARAQARGIATAAQGQAFITMLTQLPIVVDTETAARSLGTTLDVARQYGLSAYDASYLELALRRQLPMATFDRELRRAAQKAGVQEV